jgi:hypothetical protein
VVAVSWRWSGVGNGENEQGGIWERGSREIEKKRSEEKERQIEEFVDRVGGGVWSLAPLMKWEKK